MRHAILITCTCLIAVSAGCGDGRPQRVPVSGSVSIDGSPVAVGSIILRPASGRQAAGQLDQNGRFSVSTYESSDGCVPGEYSVTVYAVEQINADTLKWYVPKKYQSTATSGLKANIEGPTESLDFALTWDGVKGPVLEKVEPSE